MGSGCDISTFNVGFGFDLVQKFLQTTHNMSFGIDGRLRGCGSDKSCEELCRWLVAGMKLE